MFWKQGYGIAAIVAVFLAVWGGRAYAQPTPAGDGSLPKISEEKGQADVEAEKLKARLEELNRQIVERRADATKASDDLVQIKTELEQRRKDLDAAKGDAVKAEEIRKQITDLEKREGDQNKKVDDLNKQKEDLQGKLSAMETQRNALQTEIAKLEALIQQYTDEGIGQIRHLVTVNVGGKEVVFGSTELVEIKDADGACTITVTLLDKLQKAGIRKLKAAKIQTLELVIAADGRMLQLPPDALSMEKDAIVLTWGQVCDPNRATLGNQTDLNLRIGFLGADNASLKADFRLRYVRSLGQFDMGVGMYFAGGDLAKIKTDTAFSLFPAFRIGGRFNVPAGDANRDFYLQFNVLFGGGFVVGKKTDASSVDPADPNAQPQSESAKILSLFAGGTIEIGKYLEAGYAYDILNKSHLLVFAPGRLLSSSILTY